MPSSNRIKRTLCHSSFESQLYIGLACLFLTAVLELTECRLHKGAALCERYDRAQCLEGKGPCNVTVQECANMTSWGQESLDEAHNYMQCFASWLVINNSYQQLIKKGCWMNDNRCDNTPECVENRYAASVYFCCCDRDFCNRQYSHQPTGEQLYPSHVQPPQDILVSHAAEQQLTKTVLYSIVPILGFGVLVVTLFFMWQRHRTHMGHILLPSFDPSLSYTPIHSSLNLQLVELRARGRYGSIWKATLPELEIGKSRMTSNGVVLSSCVKHVAVKIFPLQEKSSWVAELEIYNLPHMKHENVLQFMAPERREDNLVTELWLITEFHKRGSLCDYLKTNTVTWATLCHIGESLVTGLAFLHDEIPASNGRSSKPAIAHRDFKSKNVLLKDDLTACIADFGLAQKFEPGKVFSDSQSQVGTRRYMAPEVLEGAICFTLDSFLRIDMYACSLVLWELMTRCPVNDGPVEPYRLPFEAEVGLQPTLEEMQTLVVTQKKRPIIKPAWFKHPKLSGLISTLEECWDQDAEARLSAGCVKERLKLLAQSAGSAASYGCESAEEKSFQSPLPMPASPQTVSTMSVPDRIQPNLSSSPRVVPELKEPLHC